MYAIVKDIGNGQINVVSNPGTGQPMFWESYKEAAEWGAKNGFLSGGAEVVNIDPEMLR